VGARPFFLPVRRPVLYCCPAWRRGVAPLSSVGSVRRSEPT
jgi:hypothetical protein